MRTLTTVVVVLLLTASAGFAADGPAVVARIAVPGSVQPCASVSSGRFVWVSTYAAPTLVKIDPRRNTVVARATIGQGSCGLGYGAGSLWVEDTNSGTVSRVSAATGKRLAAIPVGALPYDATFVEGAAWVTSNGGGQLARIDPARNRVVRRFACPSATGVVGGFGSVWATCADGVIRVDPVANRVVARIPLTGSGWTAASAEALWVTTPTGLARIDPSANTVAGVVSLVGPLGDPAVVAGQVWVPQVRRNRVLVIDPATMATVRSVKVGSGPFVVTEIAGEAWIPSWHGNDVWRLRP
jgi:DNA-binding beta-propeller fold protein YncE